MEKSLDVGDIIDESLKLSSSQDDDSNREINFGISCLLNHLCHRGQSKQCQSHSKNVLNRFDEFYSKTCRDNVDCKLSVVRAFEESIANFPMAFAFVFQEIYKEKQHPQIGAGFIRMLQNLKENSIGNENCNRLIERLQSDPIEIRYALVDLVLSHNFAISNSNVCRRKVSEMLNRLVLNEESNEFRTYLQMRLMKDMSKSKTLRNAYSNTILPLFKPTTSSSDKPVTSVYIGSSLFNAIPLDYLLDVQNVATDTLIHSSFTVRSGNWRMFEVEIDAVGMQQMMASLLGTEQTGEQNSEAIEPAASMTLKLGSAFDDLGIKVARHGDLFRGQDAVMSAVWNAPSEPISVATVNSPVLKLKTKVKVLSGIEIESEIDYNLLVSVSGQASISLWSQTAETVIATKYDFDLKNSVCNVLF